MNTYRVYREEDIWNSIRTITDCYYIGENNSHVFYKVRPDEPEYVYPVSKFVVMREV